MAKPVTIMQNKMSQTFASVKKIRTNLVGEGTQNWVPEDEAADYAKIKKGSFNENGTYYASEDDKDAYNEVKVRVPSEQLKLKGLKVTENGTYTAESQNIDGFNNVSVNVSGGGTGGVDYTIEWEKVSDTAYGEQFVEYNGKIYGRTYNGGIYAFDGSNWEELPSIPNGLSGRGTIVVYDGKLCSVGFRNVYYFTGSSWEILPNSESGGIYYAGCVEYNGELHTCGEGGFQTGEYTTHRIFDGNSWRHGVETPIGGDCNPFVYDGELYIIPAYGTNKLYKYTGNGWTEIWATEGVSRGYGDIIVNGKEKKLMGIYGTLPQTFNGQFLRPEELPNGSSALGYACSLNGEPYYISSGVYKGIIILAGENNG